MKKKVLAIMLVVSGSSLAEMKGDILNKIFLIMILGGMVVSIYIIGKKYE